MKLTTFRRLLGAGAVCAAFGAGPAFAAPASAALLPSDKPADRTVTVQAPNGLLINKCVPEPLRRYTISFRATDGVRVSGLVLGSGKKGLVLEHEHGWDICSWLPFAQILASKGYHVLLLEQRGTGASAASEPTHFNRDFLAAAQELTRRGATAIIAGGASLGGTAAASSAPKIPNLAGLVLFSSPRRDGDGSDKEMDAIAAIRTVTKPSFFAASPGDASNDAYLHEVQALYKASGATEKHMETPEGGIHGVDMMESKENGAALQAKLLAFIADAFRKAGVSDSPATNAPLPMGPPPMGPPPMRRLARLPATRPVLGRPVGRPRAVTGTPGRPSRCRPAWPRSC
ncbi:MAG TPA: alpha/beta fold hydrolase [Kribbellaceae bacterium]|jgi:pimeloyl-ACP methyl ester carboxylesterase